MGEKGTERKPRVAPFAGWHTFSPVQNAEIPAVQGNACSTALRLRARIALQRICVVHVLFARLGADRARQTLTDATLAAGGWRLSVPSLGVAIFHWA